MKAGRSAAADQPQGHRLGLCCRSGQQREQNSKAPGAFRSRLARDPFSVASPGAPDWLCALSAPALPQDEIPENLAKASNTIAWWQSRQAGVQARLSERRGVAAQVRSAPARCAVCSGQTADAAP